MEREQKENNERRVPPNSRDSRDSRVCWEVGYEVREDGMDSVLDTQTTGAGGWWVLGLGNDEVIAA